MKIGRAAQWIVLLVLLVSTLPLTLKAIGKTAALGELGAQGSAKTEAKPNSQAQADAANQKILAACHVDENETDPKKIDKQVDCVVRAVAAQRRKIAAEKALKSTLNRAYGVSATQGEVISSEAATAAVAPSAAGASATDTATTCGPGTGTNNPQIRVHRLLMAPKNASDDFGYRLGKRYIVYQITISNDNKDFQYLIHDVSLDLSPLFFADPGTYRYAASSQDLTLLRGIPEKGQDLDRRNLTLHILQGIGSVGGAVSGLTAFSDVMGSSVAVFNGAFLQSYVGIAPDHTGTQLNRLSDSAYITNTLIDKQRAKTIAIFIPEATILSKANQKEYWKDPYTFLQDVNLNKADVCVDGAFITTLASPTLTAAVLVPKVAGTMLAANVSVTLTVIGTNLTAGDTQVVGLGDTPVALSTVGASLGSVALTLPQNYSSGMPVHLTSLSNPSVTSATIPTTLPSPTLTAATLTPKVAGTALASGVAVTLTVQGTNLIAGDTQVVGFGGGPIILTTAGWTSGSVELTLPANYSAGMQIHLTSLANPGATSATIATTMKP